MYLKDLNKKCQYNWSSILAYTTWKMRVVGVQVLLHSSVYEYNIWLQNVYRN